MATNPLTDVLPSQARKYLYAIAFLAAWVFAAFQAADGDWKQFTGAVLAGLVPLLAASNTDTGSPPRGEGGFATSEGALLLLVLTFVGVVLLLFGVSFAH